VTARAHVSSSIRNWLSADAGLSLSEGAIRGWDRRNVYYFHMLQSLAKHYAFDLDKPFGKLPKKVTRDSFFTAAVKKRSSFKYTNDRGDRVNRRHPFEGVLNNMDRRYRETESGSVREELARYLNHSHCTDCGGSRLAQGSPQCFHQRSLMPDITRMPVGMADQYFGALELTGKRREIADKILKEIRERLQFLVNVGLDYLALDRKAETLSGGEAQRIRLASQIGAGLVGVMYVLDEPSIGLHQRDNERLLHTLHRLSGYG
jgi:excinuclease ABC subunit A